MANYQNLQYKTFKKYKKPKYINTHINIYKTINASESVNAVVSKNIRGLFAACQIQAPVEAVLEDWGGKCANQEENNAWNYDEIVFFFRQKESQKPVAYSVPMGSKVRNCVAKV